MEILVGFEESQEITKAFRERGHIAYSCDILPCSGGHPEWHIQSDIKDVIKDSSFYVPLIILHPPCTKLAVSGNRWYGKGKDGYNERLASIMWTNDIWELAKKRSNRTALENPVSVIFNHIRYNDLFYIQPYQFGHGETKKTGFATVGLPRLKPTNIVDGREQRIWKMPPSPQRKILRSKTYPGIAEAIAKQWGSLL